MAKTVRRVNHFRRMVPRGLLLASLLLAWPVPAGEPAYLVAPVKEAEDVRLLPAAAWPPAEASQAENLLKHYYLRGFLDAVQLSEAAPGVPGRVLAGLAGHSLTDLAAALDAHYRADPARRREAPASVLVRVLAAPAPAAPAAPAAQPEAKAP